jgi:hypothetical protein
MRTPVHNANFLGAALLARLDYHVDEPRFRDVALSLAQYSASKQLPDGSWAYGEGPTQDWIDNFHTGFNLCALRDVAEHIGTNEFDRTLDSGVAFYHDHFFTSEGAAKYFHDRIYPVDIHSVAQSVITLLRFDDRVPSCRSTAKSVLRWALRNMWDERGYFYYRAYQYWTNRISYMRWSQAWMAVALAAAIESELTDVAG